jgi:S-adenosylmethionine:diacylglycerol 3-amino-3-carboxypropyl transferase
MSDAVNEPGRAGSTIHNLATAVCQNRLLSREGLSERLFAGFFSGLVYPQIWEDPQVDMDAMELGDHHRIVTIASGGCNILAYLTRNPDRIDAVDLNAAHVALNRLKLTAMRSTAAPCARLIFRTAGRPSILDGRLPGSLLERWQYRRDESETFCRQDSSAIYGGFHLYVRRDA